jgi:hypothetical protein
LKNVIKKSRSILSIALVLTIALSQVFSLTGSFFNVKADPVKTLADLQALLEEAEGVVQEAEEDPYRYLPSTYQRLLEAIEKAQEVYDAGVEDGTELETVDIVGGPDDPNWEVKNPNIMDPGYTPKDQQTTVFGAEHMVFVPNGAQLVRCTYVGGQGKYGVDGQFGTIDFRYNRSQNPLPLNFKNDSISLSIVSGFYPSLPENAVKSFTIVLSFSENIPDISIPWMISGNDYATPNSNSVFEATINLADVLTKEYAKSYADLYLAPLDYKVNVEYIRIDQTIEYNGDVGLSFVINEFSRSRYKMSVTNAYNELQAALDGLEETSKKLAELLSQWEDVPIGTYSPESYAELQAALANARDVIAAGVTDGSTVTVPLVGGLADNPKWEVLKPDGNYVVWSDQKSAFAGVDYIEFSSYGEDGVKAVYLPEAAGKYDHPTGYGMLNFRYNHSEDLPVIDFKRDKLRVKIKSSIEPELTHAVNFKICMQFKDVNMPWGQADINIPWMIDGEYIPGEDFHEMPVGEITFEADIDLAWVLEQEWETDYLDGLFAGLDYKPELEYIWFRQDIQQAGADVTGVCFIIEELSLEHALTPVADAVAELEAAIAGLEIDYLKALQALVEQWEDEPGDDYTAESYAAFQAALAQARAAIASGEPDRIETVSIVGGPDDPNWEVKNPNSMEPGYTPKDQQIATFGAEHMVFVPYGADLVRCTYVGGQDEYGVPGQFGTIDFRYNRSANPLPLNFKNDSISLSIVSGFYPSLPEDAVKSFTIVLSFHDTPSFNKNNCLIVSPVSMSSTVLFCLISLRF